MPIYQDDIIEIRSDEGSPAPAPSIQSTGVPSASATPAISTGVFDSARTSSSKLPRSRILTGKTFAFRGTWLTMTVGAAEDLCKANGGEVALAITARTQYVVIGGKGTIQNTKKFTEHGATLIAEADFLGMILSKCNANKENVSLLASTNHKRSLEEPDSGPSKPAKARKSDPTPEEDDMKWLHCFLRSGEVQMKGKTLVAYDCGGEVFKAQRGKSAFDLLRKFNTFLEDCKGEYR